MGHSNVVYTMVLSWTHVPVPPSTGPVLDHGGPVASGTLYGGIDGTLFHGTSTSAPTSNEGALEGGFHEATQGNMPPKFHKLEFMTYDGSVDPLNWLTHCEQFFRGQFTPASQRTWMASYHLTGAAQMWYYALEQDEGMLPWDRFKDLCRLRFEPPIRGTRLAELGRLPFHSSVEEFAGRFQAVLAHARNISTRQKAELFVGGLPDHIRVDVEMRDPGDL